MKYESPAEISTVSEIVKDALVDAIATLQAGSRSSMKRETRGIRGALAAIIVALGSGGLWVGGKYDAWQESQRTAWEIEAKQAEQEAAMLAHLAEPHVSPEQIAALQGQIAALAGQLAAVQVEPKIEKRKGGR